MAISDAQKVDLLYKKLFGVAKTDLSANKSPSNESIASPLLNRGDKIWVDSISIPATAAAVPNVVAAYQTTGRIECTADTTSTPVSGVYPTWKTNLTDWIPPEFGSTYFIKVYAATTGTSDPTGTTPLSDTGIGGVGEWYFDYQSGVLNFIGGTIPAALTASLKIFITGYRYIGNFGYGNANVASYLTTYSGNLSVGNITSTGNISAYNVNGNIYTNSITSIGTNGNVNLNPTGSGIVAINSSTALLVPVGTSGNYPSTSIAGMIRWNTTYNYLEVYTGATWEAVGLEGTTVVTSDSFTGNGVQTQFTLTQSGTTQGTLVSINGVLQLPTTSYTVSGQTLTFVEAPLSTDVIEARTYTPSQQVVALRNSGANVLATVTGLQPNVQLQINSAITFSSDGFNTALIGNLVINGVTTNRATTRYNVAKFTNFANVDNLSLTTFSNGFPAISAISGSINVYWSATLNKSTYPYPNNYVNPGSIITSGTYSNLQVPAAISVGGDTAIATIQDQDTGRVYRGTWMQTAGVGNATVICERLM